MEARRVVEQADAIEWLAQNGAEPGASVVTSLPDLSEMPLDFAQWRSFFIGAAETIIRWVPENGVAIFYQSDIRRDGALVHKGHWVMTAAENAGASLVWHKIVCRKPPGTLSPARPSYSHMIAVSQKPRGPGKRAGADVIADGGYMSWSKAMGLEAARVAVQWLVDETETRVVVDPFCGRGTVLAVANDLGLDAFGVDLSEERCRAARAFRTDDPRVRPHRSSPQ